MIEANCLTVCTKRLLNLLDFYETLKFLVLVLPFGDIPSKAGYAPKIVLMLLTGLMLYHICESKIRYI